MNKSCRFFSNAPYIRVKGPSKFCCGGSTLKLSLNTVIYITGHSCRSWGQSSLYGLYSLQIVQGCSGRSLGNMSADPGCEIQDMGHSICKIAAFWDLLGAKNLPSINSRKSTVVVELEEVVDSTDILPLLYPTGQVCMCFSSHRVQQAFNKLFL